MRRLRVSSLSRPGGRLVRPGIWLDRVSHVIRVTTQVSCGMDGCTHYLVLRIPIRRGWPSNRRQKAPVIRNYELTVTPIIKALGTVIGSGEYREIKKAIDRILRD